MDEYYAVPATGDAMMEEFASACAYLERPIGDAPGLKCRDRG